MPTILLERYVSEMDSLAASSLLDMATASDYSGWDQRTRETWWNAQERRIRQVEASTTGGGRTRGFTWNGTPISPAALKQNLASTLGRGFARD